MAFALCYDGTFSWRIAFLLQEIQQDVEAGNLENIIVKDDIDSEGGEMTLAEMQKRLGDEDDDEETNVASGPVTDIELDIESSRQHREAAQEAAEASNVQTPQVLASPEAEQPGSLGATVKEFGDAPSEQQPAAGTSSSRPREGVPLQEAHAPFRRPRSDERVELRDSALNDSLTTAEGQALLQSLGSSGRSQSEVDKEKEARMQQVQQQAQSAGKFFMDSLARNAGLAADPDMQPSESPEVQQSLDMIDAIAEGREVDVPEPFSSGAPSWQEDSTADTDAASAQQEVPAEELSVDEADAGQPSIKLVDNLEVLVSLNSPEMTVLLPVQMVCFDGMHGNLCDFMCLLGPVQDGEKTAQKIMSDLDKTFGKLRQETDKDKVTEALRTEAWEPTKDALKVIFLPSPLLLCCT